MSLAAARAFRRAVLASLLSALPLAGHGQDVPSPGLDVPFVPTPPEVVELMLTLAEVKPDDQVIDLGSGDGRIPIAAVRDHGARQALGIDLDPQRVEEARENAERAGVADRVRFEQGDLFEQDFSDADVLTMYLLPRINLRLRPVILDTLAPGTRVVSHAFSMGSWEPDETAAVGGNYVYLWVVPAKIEGSWRVETDAGAFELSLDQHFQVVEGQAMLPTGREVVQGRVRGDEVRFTLGKRDYVGRVAGDRIEAVAEDGAVKAWSATRS